MFRNRSSDSVPTIKDLFHDGNYTAVAMLKDAEHWETYASLGLIGKTEDAIKGLSHFDCNEARFYSAVAYWINGDDGKALKILSDLKDEISKKLFSLISKPQINVLAQVRHDTTQYYSMMDAISYDNKFKVTNVSYHPDDIFPEPYADVSALYEPNNPPDFYYCHQIEYQVIPPNLQQLPCPILGYTADYDLHIQACFPWLKLFDSMVVTSDTEHTDVAGLVSVPVYTFPKMFGVDNGTIDVGEVQKEYDIFISGIIIHPYHEDKAQLALEILKMDDVNVKVLNGMVDEQEYNRLLAKSKVCFTFVRHPGAMPSRGVEALHRGCAIVVQEESCLNLFFKEEQGVLTYRDKESFVYSIKKILANWAQFEKYAKEGSVKIKKEFVYQRCVSQYFRFLTYIASMQDKPRGFYDQDKLEHKRVLIHGGLQADILTVQLDSLKRNVERWEKVLSTKDKPLLLYNDYARELVISHVSGLLDGSSIFLALKIYRQAIKKNPYSLVLKFNMVRTALHYGNQNEIEEAVKIIEEVLEIDPIKWEIDVFEDVFPYDFFNTCFNYRKYLDFVNIELGSGESTRDKRYMLIAASLRYYLSYHRNGLYNIERSVEMEGDFPYYQLRYASLLVEGNRMQFQHAVHILKNLSCNSTVFKEAYSILLRATSRIDKDLLIQFSKMKSMMERMNARLDAIHQQRRIENISIHITQGKVKFQTPIQRMKNQLKKVAIFGAGPTGQKCLEELLNVGIKVVCYIDNFPPSDRKFLDIPVYHPQIFVQDQIQEVDGIVLASCGRKYQMKHQLDRLGVSIPVISYQSI